MRVPSFALALALAVLALPAAAADAEHGRQLFIACAACHSDRPDALGPNLKGVVVVCEEFRNRLRGGGIHAIWRD